MANPFFKALGAQQKAQSGNPMMNFIGQFPKFMQQMRGQNPNQIINSLLSSGKISQQQLNAIQLSIAYIFRCRKIKVVRIAFQKCTVSE